MRMEDISEGNYTLGNLVGKTPFKIRKGRLLG